MDHRHNVSKESTMGNGKHQFRFILRKKDGVDLWIMEEEYMDPEGKLHPTCNHMDEPLETICVKHGVEEFLAMCEEFKVDSYPLHSHKESTPLVSEWINI